MGRNISPKCKRCRREGEKLFLKGERCNTQNCSVAKRNYPPGMHGPVKARRLSEYGLQLREKQKVKKIYGILERQLEKYFNQASKKKGATDKNLIISLETRLDNAVYRLGYAKSRDQARQLVNHGHFYVNNRRTDIPSCQVKIGDKISLKPNFEKSSYFQTIKKSLKAENVPSWLVFNPGDNVAEVVASPRIEDLDQSFDTRLIIEFYSR